MVLHAIARTDRLMVVDDYCVMLQCESVTELVISGQEIAPEDVAAGFWKFEAVSTKAAEVFSIVCKAAAASAQNKT